MPVETTDRAVPVWAWLLWSFSGLAASYCLFVGTAFWQINCPGAAELSTQRTVCEDFGPWGGPALMAVGLVNAAIASCLLLRGNRSAALRSNVLVILLALMPLAGPVVVYAGLTAPGDYCSAEERREEQRAQRRWDAADRAAPRPDRCLAYEGS